MPLIVNGQRIDDSIVDSEFGQIKSYYEQLGNVSCCERDPEFRGYARENVIARALLAQAATRRIEKTPDDQVQSALAKLIADYGGEVNFYASTGARPDQIDLVRHDIDIELRVKRMLDDLSADITPSDESLRQFYETHIATFMTAEEVRASHILKSPTRGEARAGAYEELRQVRKQLAAGEDFDTLAKAHSDKADDHIDLGFFKRGELAEEFETVAFSLEVGEVSPVFLSPFGLHLMKLTERKPSVAKPFEEVRNDVEQLFRQDVREQRMRALVAELKGTAVVEDVEDVPAEPLTV